MRQRCLAQAGRTGQQDVVKHIVPSTGGFHKQFQTLLDPGLSHKIPKFRGPQTDIQLSVFLIQVGYQWFLHGIFQKLSIGFWYSLTLPSSTSVNLIGFPAKADS